MIIIGTTLWVLAAICNAVMDTLVHHFYGSAFADMDHDYWDPNISWKNKYVDKDPEKGMRKLWIFDYPVFLTDGWHLFKTIMIFCLCGALACFHFSSGYSQNWESGIIIFVLYGAVWNVVFSVFYNYILN